MKLFEVELRGAIDYEKHVFAENEEQAKRAILASKFYRAGKDLGIDTKIKRIREIKPKVPIVFNPFIKF